MRKLKANIENVVLYDGNGKQINSRKSSSLTRLFVDVPIKNFPKELKTFLKLVKNKGFEDCNDIGIESVTSLRDMRRYFSLYVPFETHFEKEFENKGIINLSMEFMSRDFSDSDLSYARMNRDNNFDFFKMLQIAKWKSSMEFYLERWSCNGKENQIESLGFRYLFDFEGGLKNIVCAEANFEIDEKSKPHEDNIRYVWGWDGIEEGYEMGYDNIMQMYFDDLGGNVMTEKGMKGRNIKKVIKKDLPYLIEQAERIVLY